MDPTGGYLRKAYITARRPSTRELGWLGHVKGNANPTTGKRDSVQIKFDPNDAQIQNSYMTHTHPSDNPSPLGALPSEQDLESVLNSCIDHGIQGGVIFCGPYYTVYAPTTKAKNRTNYRRYLEAVSRNDIEDAFVELKRCGWDVETGKM